MRNVYTSTSLALLMVFTGLSFGSMAWAEEGKVGLRSGYGVDKEVRASFEKRRAMAVRPERATAPAKVQQSLQVVARLARFDDGVVMLAVPVNATRQAALLRVGAHEVETEASVRSHCIYGGNYYRAYQAPGLEPGLFQRYLGQQVRIELVRTDAGASYIASITGA